LDYTFRCVIDTTTSHHSATHCNGCMGEHACCSTIHNGSSTRCQSSSHGSSPIRSCL
jgi:hypothetical protein